MKQLFFVEVDLVSPADGPLVERLLLHAAARQCGELAVATSVAVSRQILPGNIIRVDFRDDHRMAVKVGGAQ